MRGLLIFVLGAIVGALALQYYYQTHGTADAGMFALPSDGSAVDKAKSSANNAAEKTRDAAVTTKDSIAAKLREWKLTPDDIKHDLAGTGEVIRSKAKVANEKIADARIVTVIKAKYVLERDLSAFDISVDSVDGTVTLAGKVSTSAAIGKAIVLALETEGVHDVISKLSVVGPR